MTLNILIIIIINDIIQTTGKRDKMKEQITCW